MHGNEQKAAGAATDEPSTSEPSPSIELLPGAELLPNPELDDQLLKNPEVKAFFGELLNEVIKAGKPVTRWELGNLNPGDCLEVARDQRRGVSSLIYNAKKVWPRRRFALRTSKRGSFVWRID